MILTVIAFLLILSLLVFVHEFGHFFVAKRLGIKVEEFGFGLPPRVFGVKRGETIYSINALPFGGFVKLYGEEDIPGRGKTPLEHPGKKQGAEDVKRAFFARPPLQRTMVVVAGVLMNVVLAVAIYYVFLFISGFKTEIPLLGDHRFFLVDQTNKTNVIVSQVLPNSPAEKAGISGHSKIVSVNGEDISNVAQFIAIVDRNRGKEIVVMADRLEDNTHFSVKVTPRVSPPQNEGPLGVGLSSFEMAILSYDTPLSRLFSGIIHPANLFVYNMKIIGKLIGFSVEEKSIEPISEGVTGPLGVFVVVGNILEIPEVKEKTLQILNFSGLISISLAFFNILPIPALDGGRLLFIVLEMVTRRRIAPRYEAYAHAVAFAILVALVILITIKDFPLFLRFISGKGVFQP